MRVANVLFAEGLFGNNIINSSEEVAGNDLIVLWGGADIASSLYNERPVYTSAGVISGRDLVEKAVAEKAFQLGIPILGVCRGAQLLTVLAGGKLFQDVEGHTSGHHKVYTHSGEFYTNTVHHQAMRLPQGAELLAWSEVGGKRRNEDGEQRTGEPEVEAAYLPKHKALCIQWHPEWLPKGTKAVGFVLEQLKAKFNLDWKG